MAQKRTRTKKEKGKYYHPLLFIIILLTFIGILMVSSSSFYEGLKEQNSATYFMSRQIIFVILGCILAFLCYKLPLSIFRKLSFPAWLLSLFLCLLLFTKLGYEVKGSVRWLTIPKIGLRFMPSELLKYSSIFFVAHLLVINRSQGRKEGFRTIFLVILLSVGVIIINDFSTASVMALSLFGMFFIAGITIKELMIILIVGISGAAGFIKVMPYRVSRLKSFLDPFDDVKNTDWQLANSLYALAMGGITGVGYFDSRQKAGYLPEAYNDFIFAVIGEEFGLIGTVFVVILFSLFVIVGMLIAIQRKNLYEKLVASGITLSIGVQAFFNMGVNCGILPVTGITLPFISYGGTSIMLTIGICGILLNLARE